MAPPVSHWTGLPCSRSRRPSPPALSATERAAQRQREAKVLEVGLQRKRMDELELAFHKGKAEGCPKCGKMDKVTRKGSSHLIHNLRCERCDLRIGCVRIA